MQESATANKDLYCHNCGKLKSQITQPRPTDSDLLREFGHEIYARAGRNAINVNEVLLAIVGAIVWLKDDNPIELCPSEDQTQKVLLVSIGGRRYSFLYNEETRQIDLRETEKGALIYSFSNRTETSKVRLIFKTL